MENRLELSSKERDYIISMTGTWIEKHYKPLSGFPGWLQRMNEEGKYIEPKGVVGEYLT